MLKKCWDLIIDTRKKLVQGKYLTRNVQNIQLWKCFLDYKIPEIFTPVENILSIMLFMFLMTLIWIILQLIIIVFSIYIPIWHIRSVDYKFVWWSPRYEPVPHCEECVDLVFCLFSHIVLYLVPIFLPSQ